MSWQPVQEPLAASTLKSCKVMSGSFFSTYEWIDFQLNGEPCLVIKLLKRTTFHALRWSCERKTYEWKGTSGNWYPVQLMQQVE